MITIISEGYSIENDFFTSILDKIFESLETRGNVVIKLGDTNESRSLNAQYRNKDYATDVLSFPFEEELPDGYYLGDIHICFPIAEEQAKEDGITIQHELITLMVHGLLHLAGYDHETDEGEMLTLQNQLLKRYYL